MSAHIHSWIDGLIAVRHRAYETRGQVQLESGARWPRTTGADVIAIAAMFDDAILINGTPGIALRWRAMLADLERKALRAPRETYLENRTFWATLETVAVFLDDLAVTPPHPLVWDTLLAEIGSGIRNVGPTEDGPIAHFDGINTFDDLWRAQRSFLAEKRGSDVVPPPAGFGGGPMGIPRSTNQDVLQLATYWSEQLAKATQVMGYAGVLEKWKGAIADVEQLAKPGNPGDVYAKNNEFWRRSLEVAIQVAIGDEAPSKWDLVVESVKDSVKQLPQTIGSGLSKGVGLVEDAGHAVGAVVAETGKGLVAGLGTPVVLVGAGLLGLYLMTRDSAKDKEA